MERFFSIIIPCYNVEMYIAETINSILKQKYNNFEIIAIDDGSTDNTLSILEKIEDKRLKIIKQKNMGAPIARNRGLVTAKGDYIIFFDSDDIMCLEALECVNEYINLYNCDIYIGGFYKINEKNTATLDCIKYRKQIIKNNVVKSCFNLSPLPINKIYKKSIIEENSLSWGNVRIGQDLEFFLKYLIYCKKACIMDSCISKYRIVNTGISKTYSLKIFDIVKVFDNIKSLYYQNNVIEVYKNEIAYLQIKHYIFQMEKYKFFDSENKNQIIDFFDSEIKKVKNYDSIKCYIKKIEFMIKRIIFLNKIRKNKDEK